MDNINKEEVFYPISSDDLIGDLITMYPETEGFLAELGMHCAGCGMAAGENIRQACKSHGLDTVLVVKELNKIVRGESEYA